MFLLFQRRIQPRRAAQSARGSRRWAAVWLVLGRGSSAACFPSKIPPGCHACAAAAPGSGPGSKHRHLPNAPSGVWKAGVRAALRCRPQHPVPHAARSTRALHTLRARFLPDPWCWMLDIHPPCTAPLHPFLLAARCHHRSRPFDNPTLTTARPCRRHRRRRARHRRAWAGRRAAARASSAPSTVPSTPATTATPPAGSRWPRAMFPSTLSWTRRRSWRPSSSSPPAPRARCAGLV